MKDLAGKVAVVTGGASGIGLAMAKAFAAEGMRILMADVEEGALKESSAQLKDTGATVHSVACDVSDAGAVEGMAEMCIAELGGAHVVCNNAGVASAGMAWQQSQAQWEWVVGVNLWGVVHGVRSFVPRMIAQGEGHVVNTASMAGLVPLPMSAPYALTKHAVVGLSETLYHELRMIGAPVGVSVLCPGWVNTRIAEADRNWPGRLGDSPAEAGDPGAMEAGLQLMKSILAQGMDPSDVARKVVDAVKEDRFWILTHPEMGPAVTERYRRAVDGLEPALGFGGLVPGFD